MKLKILLILFLSCYLLNTGYSQTTYTCNFTNGAFTPAPIKSISCANQFGGTLPVSYRKTVSTNPEIFFKMTAVSIGADIVVNIISSTPLQKQSYANFRETLCLSTIEGINSYGTICMQAGASSWTHTFPNPLHNTAQTSMKFLAAIGYNTNGSQSCQIPIQTQTTYTFTTLITINKTTLTNLPGTSVSGCEGTQTIYSYNSLGSCYNHYPQYFFNGNWFNYPSSVYSLPASGFNAAFMIALPSLGQSNIALQSRIRAVPICPFLVTITTALQSINVFAKPQASIQILNSEENFCDVNPFLLDYKDTPQQSLASTIVQFSSDEGINFVDLVTTSLPYSASNAGVYRFRIESDEGCVAYTNVIAVKEPEININFTATKTPCTKEITLSDSTTDKTPAEIHVDWGDGFSKTYLLEEEIKHTYSNYGTKTITYTPKFAGGCVYESKTQEVEIPNPITFNITNTPICLSTAVEFTNESELADTDEFTVSQKVYLIPANTLLVDTENQIATINFSSSGQKTLKFVFTSNLGCTYEHTKNILVNPPATTNFSVVGNNSLVFCERVLKTQQKIKLKSTSTPQNRIAKYEWEILDSSTGSFGEVVYDTETDSLFFSTSTVSAGVVKIKLTTMTIDSCYSSKEITYTINPIVTGNHTMSVVPNANFPGEFNRVNMQSTSTFSVKNEIFLENILVATSSTNTLSKQFPLVDTIQNGFVKSIFFRNNPSDGCDSIKTTYFELPPKFTIKIERDSACVGKPLLIKNISNFTTGEFLTSWKITDTTTNTILASTTSNNELTIPPRNTTGFLYVKVEMQTSTNRNFKDNLSIFFHPKPIPNFSLASTPNMCFENLNTLSQITFISNSQPQASITSGQWTVINALGSSIISQTKDSLVLDVSNITAGELKISLKVTNLAGCDEITTKSFVILPKIEVKITNLNIDYKNCDNVVKITANSEILNNQTRQIWKIENSNGNLIYTTSTPPIDFNIPLLSVDESYKISLFADRDGYCSNEVFEMINLRKKIIIDSTNVIITYPPSSRPLVSVQLPALPTGDYAYIITWGDNSDPTLTTNVQEATEHTYPFFSDLMTYILKVEVVRIDDNADIICRFGSPLTKNISIQGNSILAKSQLTISNRFTPNGDAENDFIRFVASPLFSKYVEEVNWRIIHNNVVFKEGTFSNDQKQTIDLDIWDGTKNGNQAFGGSYFLEGSVIFNVNGKRKSIVFSEMLQLIR